MQEDLVADSTARGIRWGKILTLIAAQWCQGIILLSEAETAQNLGCGFCYLYDHRTPVEIVDGDL